MIRSKKSATHEIQPLEETARFHRDPDTGPGIQEPQTNGAGTMSESTRQPAPPVRPPATRIILVRHGETEDVEGIPDHSGHGDPDLSRLGREQALAIARQIAELSDTPVTAIYTSPLAAALTTASVIGDRLGLSSPEPSHGLVTIAPETLPPGRSGIDAMAALQSRAWSAVERLRELHPPPSALILVSHELPIRATICRALSIDLEQSTRFRIDPASISRLEFRGPRTVLASLNDVCQTNGAGQNQA